MPVPIICPDCRAAIALDERDIGTHVECGRCRSRFLADQSIIDDKVLGKSREQRGPSSSVGRGAAFWCILLGVGAVFTSPCLGLGGLLGLIGLFTGYNGLRSNAREVSIIGMLACVVGIVLSAGIIVFMIALMMAMQDQPPPNPDGTQAPFASQF